MIPTVMWAGAMSPLAVVLGIVTLAPLAAALILIPRRRGDRDKSA